MMRHLLAAAACLILAASTVGCRTMALGDLKQDMSPAMVSHYQGDRDAEFIWVPLIAMSRGKAAEGVNGFHAWTKRGLGPLAVLAYGSCESQFNKDGRRRETDSRYAIGWGLLAYGSRAQNQRDGDRLDWQLLGLHARRAHWTCRQPTLLDDFRDGDRDLLQGLDERSYWLWSIFRTREEWSPGSSEYGWSVLWGLLAHDERRAGNRVGSGWRVIWLPVSRTRSEE